MRIPFLIVGGGIGGLATALALSRTGRSVHLIEKDDEFGEIGAGLQLAPNASRMLDRLGVLGEISKSAVYPKRLVWKDAISGKLLTAVNLGEPFQQRYGYRYIVMHRGDLLNVLLEACRASGRISLESGKRAIAVEDSGDGARVCCADGVVYDCDAVIAADGLWSAVRKFVHDDGDPVCSMYVAYRGTIPASRFSQGAPPEEMVLWTGPEKHFVRYPLRGKKLYNQVAVFRSYRYREGSYEWGTPDELDEHFAQTCTEVRDGIALMDRSRRWPILDRPPIANWTQNRITLLGDAAHPMQQYLAQGACQALEDAVTLANCVERYGERLDRAFLAYQEIRSPHTARAQLAARTFGEFWHRMPERLEQRDRLLLQRSHDDCTELDWLYRPRGSGSA
jgi:3-hydroxybenzoate 6-monooxygenase